jgi:uncharacterized caspase-like protein
MPDRNFPNRDVALPQSRPARLSRGPGRLHCVAIGIDRYADRKIRNLQHARADAVAIAGLFQQSIAPSEREIHLLVDEQATRDAIITVIGETLPRVQDPNDFVLLYFAGHGSPEHQSPTHRVSRYLVPHGADYGRIFSTGIGLEQELTALIERQSASRVLLVLDACFSGLAGGRTFVGPVLQRTRSMFHDRQVSLRDLDLGSGRAVFAACKDDELARECDGHGVFTRHLLEALTVPGEPIVSVAELYGQIHAAVVASTNNQQHPVLKGELAGLGLPRLSSDRKLAAE